MIYSQEEFKVTDMCVTLKIPQSSSNIFNKCRHKFCSGLNAIGCWGDIRHVVFMCLL